MQSHVDDAATKLSIAIRERSRAEIAFLRLSDALDIARQRLNSYCQAANEAEAQLKQALKADPPHPPTIQT